jgi:hypothetical protein
MREEKFKELDALRHQLESRFAELLESKLAEQRHALLAQDSERWVRAFARRAWAAPLARANTQTLWLRHSTMPCSKRRARRITGKRQTWKGSGAT